MSKNTRLMILLGLLLSLIIGIFVIPKLQNRCAGDLYKICNRKILRERFGISIPRKNQEG
ncbi:MAG: hypothetical protein IKY53_07825 [Lachnospiraceae bacterium]|nr:hypothetical protein [Lachnospiraceae bacterium]